MPNIYFFTSTSQLIEKQEQIKLFLVNEELKKPCDRVLNNIKYHYLSKIKGCNTLKFNTWYNIYSQLYYTPNNLIGFVGITDYNFELVKLINTIANEQLKEK